MYVRVTQKKKKKKKKKCHRFTAGSMVKEIKEKMMENVNTIFQSFIFILFFMFVCFSLLCSPPKLTTFARKIWERKKRKEKEKEKEFI